MKPFLYRVAEVIRDINPESAMNVCVVLPNRRSGLFLRKYLSEVYNKVVWAPDIFAIGDFVNEVSGVNIVELPLLMADLYKACQQVDPGTDIDTFLTYGPKVLNDFNQVDLYLVDPKVLFNYLNQAKAMTLWNLDRKPLTELQENYIRFFNRLYNIYIEFRAILSARKAAYLGMAYRAIAENTDQLLSGMKWERVIFAGFNALSKAELKIMGTLSDAGKADIFWNTDEYYADNSIQEAGYFFRQNFKLLKHEEIRWKDKQFMQTRKNITSMATSGNFAQVVAMNQVIRQWFDQGKDQSDMVIVLNDESLLFPVLSFTGNLDCKYNITMGIPLKTSPALKFSDALFSLYENSAYFSEAAQRKATVFHYKDLIRIFDTQAVKSLLLSFSPIPVMNLSEEIARGNKVFYYKQEVIDLLKRHGHAMADAGELILGDGNYTILSVTNAIEKIYNFLAGKEGTEYGKENNKAEFPFLMASMELLVSATVKVRKSMAGLPPINDLRLAHRLFNSMAEGLRIPLFGEPLEGLQIMGMLETRAVDFKHVIMLSVNEGHMPKTNIPDSFIPFDISIEFGLPTYKERDAVYAYHFYRLLQHAEDICMIYNTEPGKLGSEEKSRFILQLEHELIRVNPLITYETMVYSPSVIAEQTKNEIVISKNDTTMEKLKELALRGFSPSSIIKYKNCTLQFYFQYIAGLEETEEVTETVDQAMFGTIIHEILNRVYSSFGNRFITEDMLRTALKKYDELAGEVIKKYFPSDEMITGRNYLIAEVIKNYIDRYLSFELYDVIGKGHQLRILYLEKGMKALLRDAGDDLVGDFPVNIRGICDRIDELDGVIRIMDYKTGTVHSSDLRVSQIADLRKPSNPDKSLQVLIYRWLFMHNPEFLQFQNRTVITGIIPLKNISEGYLELEFKQGLQDQNMKDFEIFLNEIIAEMIDPGVPFKQTPEEEYCRNCLFTSICDRKKNAW